MLGMVYTVLCDMIEEDGGLGLLNDIIVESDIPYDGAITAGDLLDDGKIVGMISRYADFQDVPVEFVLRKFGEYFLTKASYAHQKIMQQYTTAPDFLRAVDGIIHKEVGKLYPGAETPRLIICESDSYFAMKYESKRKLCHFAEGLIAATGLYYKVDIGIIHSKCLHRGDNHCLFELTFND